MNGALAAQRVARAAAIAIAVAAAIDPAITTHRTARRVVTVTASDASDAPLADHVARDLDGHFTVLRFPFAGADASVLVGETLPSHLDDFASPVFTVVPDTSIPSIRLRAVDAPNRAAIHSRVPVVVRADVDAARGKQLELSLRADGLLLDRVVRKIDSEHAHLTVPLTYLPTATGTAPLRVVATLGGNDSTHADLAVDARDTQWSVLFFDPRPSWQSTFVRRALERDPRFAVASRVVTSRTAGTNAGQPPNHLDDLAGIDRFDAIVVGAPHALGAADVAGLDRFLRRRAGSVVLLFDEAVAGPYTQLTGALSWTHRALTDTAIVRDAMEDSTRLRASDLAWPAPLPIGAQPMARATFTGDTGSGPILWQLPVGSGRVIVSGALDAWRFRDAPLTQFDRYWQTLIARAAAAALPPVSVTLSPSIVRPGTSTHASLSIRDALLWAPAGGDPQTGPHVAVTTTLQSSVATAASIAVRSWPTGVVGELDGTVRAPHGTGAYVVHVTADGAAADAPLVVLADAEQPHPDERALLDRWASAHHGRQLSAGHLDELEAALDASAAPARLVTWHPMRSARWIVPFAVLLGVEWFMRRRRGAA